MNIDISNITVHYNPVAGTLLEPVKLGIMVFISEKHGMAGVAALNHMGRNTRQVKSRFTWHRDILVSVEGLHSINYCLNKD